ncbi:hypothetical protein BZG36_02186 [Bifiguratus adelaidae]|uniref:DNA mismatch repair proteins mutS family domain-containing protein n=1 Tax=Bifiguratus adelaidae TaxID=1938954 RepID=A0A261Y115_9FUNG|nr:hypothetical protein BZG36_02186 [Bifiguratus adelaidae]
MSVSKAISESSEAASPGIAESPRIDALFKARAAHKAIKRTTDAMLEDASANTERRLPNTNSVVINAVRQAAADYPGYVILTRVGDFYELYENQAAEYGPLLDLKVTSKEMTTDLTTWFTGFPARALDKYLELLINKFNRHVAISEQHGPSESGKGFHRRVTRLVTPGTVIDEQFLNPFENNYLLSIAFAPDKLPSSAFVPHQVDSIGLAWLDLSTGEYYMQQTTRATLTDDITRIGPKEIILNADMEDADRDYILALLGKLGMVAITYLPSHRFDSAMGNTYLEFLKGPTDRLLPQHHLTFTQLQLQATSALLAHVQSIQVNQPLHLQPPVNFDMKDIMKLDMTALTALEVTRTIQEGKRQDSLVWAIDKTVSRTGARLLHQWLTAPSTNMDEITRRHDFVEHFQTVRPLLDVMRDCIKSSGDPARSMQRIILGRMQHRDYAEVKEALETFQRARSIALDKAYAGHPQLADFLETPSALSELHSMLHGALDMEKIEDEEYVKSYGFIRPEYDPQLASLHSHLMQLFGQKEALQVHFRESYGSSATFVNTLAHRHVVEVNAGQAANVQKREDAKLVQKLKGGKCRFHVQEFSDLAYAIEEVEADLVEREAFVFESFRQEVTRHSHVVLRVCRVLAELDVLSSIAQLAIERHWVRPTMTTDAKCFHVVGGRHPVVEMSLASRGLDFVKNDCQMRSAKSLWLLTGPNMGGKSTFLRQNALMCILAQIGCFVSADSAHLGIVDRVFCRVGASDNLAQHQSTFMLEMMETANILHHATPNSFVIVDEIGRGTSSKEGLAIAFAVMQTLANDIGCRTLFATHYHELADLDHHPAIECFQTLVEQNEDQYTLLHKIEEGVCRNSLAIQVAEMAGLPADTVKMAKAQLAQLSE